MGRKKLGEMKKVNLCIRISPEDLTMIEEAMVGTPYSVTDIVHKLFHTQVTLPILSGREKIRTRNPNRNKNNNVKE